MDIGVADLVIFLLIISTSLWGLLGASRIALPLISSGCVKTNFEFLFSHYSTLFDYKLGLLNHFLSVFYLFLPLFATLNQIF